MSATDSSEEEPICKTEEKVNEAIVIKPIREENFDEDSASEKKSNTGALARQELQEKYEEDAETPVKHENNVAKTEVKQENNNSNISSILVQVEYENIQNAASVKIENVKVDTSDNSSETWNGEDAASQKRKSPYEGEVISRAKKRKSQAPKKIQSRLNDASEGTSEMRAMHYVPDPLFMDTDEDISEGEEEDCTKKLTRGQSYGVKLEADSNSDGKQLGSNLSQNSEDSHQPLSPAEPKESKANVIACNEAGERTLRRRNCLTLHTKIAILKRVDESKQSKAKIAVEFGIPKSTLSTIVKCRDKLLCDWHNDVPGERRKISISPYNDIEQELFKWIYKVRSQYTGPIQGSVLKAKALEIARELGITSFTASNGWLSRFKLRHKMPFFSVFGLGNGADDIPMVQSPSNDLDQPIASSSTSLSQDTHGLEMTCTSEVSNQSAPELHESVSNSPSSLDGQNYLTRISPSNPGSAFEEFEMFQKSLTVPKTTPRRRRALTLETKLEIIKCVDEKIKPRAQILADFGIPSSTLWTILKSREKILSDHKNIPANCKRICSSPYSALESELYSWICEVRKICEEPLKEGLIKAKALELAKTMGHNTFSASSGWLYRFKHRYKYNLPNSSQNNEAEGQIDEGSIDASTDNQDNSLLSTEDLLAESEEAIDSELSNHSTADSQGPTTSSNKSAKDSSDISEENIDDSSSSQFPIQPIVGPDGEVYKPPISSYEEYEMYQMSLGHNVSGPRRRRALTLETKIEIIRSVQENKLSRSEILSEYGIPSSTLWNILKCREKLLDDYRSVPADCKRVFNSRYADLEKQLYKWLREVKGPDASPVSDDLIKAKAFELAQAMGHFTFSPSASWVHRFKNRYKYHHLRQNSSLNCEEESVGNNSMTSDDEIDECERPLVDDHDTLDTEHSEVPADRSRKTEFSEVTSAKLSEQPELRELKRIFANDADESVGSSNLNNKPMMDFQRQQYTVANNFAMQAIINLQEATKATINQTCRLRSQSSNGGDKTSPILPNPNLPNRPMPSFAIPGFGPFIGQPNEPAKPTRRRNDLTLKTKIEILRCVDEGKMKRSQIAFQFGIPKSSLTSIVKFRDKIWKDWCSSVSEDSRRARITPFQDIEKELFRWICEVRATYDGPIKDTVMKAKALELARKMGNDSFTASSGWIYKFKQRMGIPVNARKSFSSEENSNSHSGNCGLPSNANEIYIQESDQNAAFDLSTTQSLLQSHRQGNSIPRQSNLQKVKSNHHNTDNSDTTANDTMTNSLNDLVDNSISDTISVHSLKNLQASWLGDQSDHSFSDLEGAYNISLPALKQQLQESEASNASHQSADDMNDSGNDDYDDDDDNSTTHTSAINGNTRNTRNSSSVNFSNVEARDEIRMFGLTSNGTEEESSNRGNQLISVDCLLQPGTSGEQGTNPLLAPYLSSQMSPHKRRALSLETKVEILRSVDERLRSRSQIAAEFGIPCSTLSTILKSRDKLMRDWSRNVPGKFKRVYDSRYGDIETQLYDWIRRNETDTGNSVKGPQIKAKALELAHQVGQPTFTASNGWLHRFKHRFGLPFKSALCSNCDQQRHLCQCC